MKKLVKDATKKVGKEALNISTRVVSGTISEIAKESIKEELEKSGVTESLKETFSKREKMRTDE
ncbi:hypothetical protein CEE45_07045 [Candidatus Heimdallarchaeota archaeon B3_Heim]|nr:MAG: hypothetical protein CEE45_07045 [Candidatus Heimdallarchaeota archaeon B3_Heim]